MRQEVSSFAFCVRGLEPARSSMSMPRAARAKDECMAGTPAVAVVDVAAGPGAAGAAGGCGAADGSKPRKEAAREVESRWWLQRRQKTCSGPSTCMAGGARERWSL